jgi:hypothetical protein
LLDKFHLTVTELRFISVWGEDETIIQQSINSLSYPHAEQKKGGRKEWRIIFHHLFS